MNNQSVNNLANQTHLSLQVPYSFCFGLNRNDSQEVTCELINASE